MNVATDQDIRTRQSHEHGYTCTLPRRRLPLSNNLHCRSDAEPQPLFPTRILFRARPSLERDHPAPSPFLLRALEMGRESAEGEARVRVG